VTVPLTSLGVITINIDPVIHLGPFQVHWYGVMYAVAFLVAFRFGVVPYAVRQGVARSVAEKITIWTIIFGLIGGRLYYVLQQPDLVSHYILQPQHLLAFWEGGMAFYGAIIAGFITLTIAAWRYRVNPWLALDGGVLFAVVGQPIGRIGNIINGDILGGGSTLPWATGYANPNALLQCSSTNCFHLVNAPGGPWYYQPAAAYEALAAILIGVLLFALVRRHVRAGVLAITYIPAYAISQLILFQVRTSEPVVLLGLHQAQWTSIGMLVIGTPLLYYLWRRTGARFETWQPQTTSLPADPVKAQ
jgi:phosphatidylglycerol:prolipoprotein diacylglycerol transferase